MLPKDKYSSVRTGTVAVSWGIWAGRLRVIVHSEDIDLLNEEFFARRNI